MVLRFASRIWKKKWNNWETIFISTYCHQYTYTYNCAQYSNFSKKKECLTVNLLCISVLGYNLSQYKDNASDMFSFSSQILYQIIPIREQKYWYSILKQQQQQQQQKDCNSPLYFPDFSFTYSRNSYNSLYSVAENCFLPFFSWTCYDRLLLSPVQPNDNIKSIFLGLNAGIIG